VDENHHEGSTTRSSVTRKGRNPSLGKDKLISPKQLNGDDQRRPMSSRLRAQLQRNENMSSTDYKSTATSVNKEDESDEYVNKKTLQQLEKVDVNMINGDGNFGPTMYERVKTRRQNTVRYDNVAKLTDPRNRHHSNQHEPINMNEEYHHRPTRSRMLNCLRERNRVVIDDEEDEISRESHEANNTSVKEEPNESNLNNDEEEEEDAPRQYSFRHKRVQPNQEPQLVQYSNGERPIRNCRIVSTNNTGNSTVPIYGRNNYSMNGRRISGNNRKHSSRRSSRHRHQGSSRHSRRRLGNESSDSSSTSSSSSDEDGKRRSNQGIKTAKHDAKQEARFERRKLKSMEKGRKNLMPVNLTDGDSAVPRIF